MARARVICCLGSIPQTSGIRHRSLIVGGRTAWLVSLACEYDHRQVVSLSLSSVSSSFALSPPVSLLLLLLLFPPLVDLMGISCSVLTVPMYGGGAGRTLCLYVWGVVVGPRTLYVFLSIARSKGGIQRLIVCVCALYKNGIK